MKNLNVPGRFSVLLVFFSFVGLAFVRDSINSQTKTENSNLEKRKIHSLEKEQSNSDQISDNVPIYSEQSLTEAEAEKPHTLVAGYYSVQNGIESKLLLNNKGGYAIEVRPTLYGIGGAILDVPPVTVDASSHRFINIRDWANLGGEGFQTGNLKLFHTGKDLIIGSQIHLTDESKSLGFEYKLGELGKFDSRQLEAVWWSPSNAAETDVVLTNTSDELITVTSKLTRKPSISNSPQTIILQPHETRVLNVRNDFNQGDVFANKDVLGLSLSNNGAKDALLAWAMTKDETTGYSNTVVFQNPNTSESKEYHGAGLQLGRIGVDKLKPVVVVRNSSNIKTVQVNVKVPYTLTNGRKEKIQLGQITLAPNEVHKVDMTEVAALRDVAVAGIEIKYTGKKGDVVASSQSVSQSKTHVFRTLLFDMLGQMSATGGYPFYIEGTSSSKAYIKNGTDREQDYVSFLIYGDHQQYMIGSKTLAPDEVVEIDVKKIRDEQIPDESGNTLPLTVAEGQIQWTNEPKQTNDNKPVPDNLGMIGQMIQVDSEKEINSTYFCGNCCVGGTLGAYITTNATDFGVGALVQFTATKVEDTCYAVPYTHQFNPSSWSTLSGSIATITNAGLATLVGSGSTQIYAFYQRRTAVETPCGGGGGGGNPPVLFEKANGYKVDKKIDDTKKVDDDGAPTENIAACGSCRNYYASTYAATTVEVSPNIQKIQYSVNGTWVDVGSSALGPICHGTLVNFRAVPVSGTFPANKPVWGGDATGRTGASISVTFSNDGSRTISATNGNSVTANINVGMANANINITWASPIETTDTANAPQTTDANSFVSEYTACADPEANLWHLRAKKVDGGTTIAYHTGGSRNPSTSPPLSQSEAIDANTVMNDYYLNGRGSWHTLAASQAHERHHDAQWTCTGDHFWPATETMIEALTVSYTTYSTEAAAITQMRNMGGGALDKMSAFRTTAGTYYLSLSDAPGSRPYAAGQLILNGEISTIVTLAANNNWTGVPGVAATPGAANPCYQPF